MDAMQRLVEHDALSRLLARDTSLFSTDPDVQAKVAARLGWIGLAYSARASAPALAAAAGAAQGAGITDIVLLGMGGSSLAPLVISKIVGSAKDHPRLHVLDTTSSWTIHRTVSALRPDETLVLVSSKSGSTIEPLSLYAWIREWADGALGPAAGGHFIAVTDPGSGLAKLAGEQGFAATFHAPADVGGRYSAMTPFATVPASLIGADVGRIAARGSSMEQSCRVKGRENPGLALASWMADAVASGRDKLTFVASEQFAPFGLWVEQLVAESTGKDGKGVLPVLERAPGDPEAYGEDRMVFVMRSYDDEELARLANRIPQGTPHFESVVYETYDIGAEFVRWEYATALLGHLLGVNPFDEPNVTEAKEATSAILDGSLHAPEPGIRLGETRITTNLTVAPSAPAGTLAATLDALLEGATTGDYLAVLAYLPEDDELVNPLLDALAELSAERQMACTFGIGPRYLHSTGQYHKGGPAKGRFLIVTAGERAVPVVPGQSYTLGKLIRAQAAGDYVTLASHDLPVVMVDLPEPAHAPVRMLAETLRGAAAI
jgi:glucose-6-phosphate isomerase